MTDTYIAARSSTTQRVAIVSLLMSFVIIGLQLYAYLLTNSVAILSSVFEAMLDIVAAITVYLALKTAHLPPDRSHRFGHGKAEALVSIFQVTLIAGSAVYLLYQSILRLSHPVAINDEVSGIDLMLVSSLLVIGLLIYQHRVAKATNSLSIKAAYLNYFNDLAVNAIVIVALALSYLTNWHGYDAIFGCLIALHILYSAWKLMQVSMHELMDHELSKSERNIIQNIVAKHPAARGMHDLRTRRAGPNIFIEFHLELEGSLTLYSAHVITDSLEEDIKQRFPGAYVSIHQEPAGIVDHRLDDVIRK